MARRGRRARAPAVKRAVLLLCLAAALSWAPQLRQPLYTLLEGAAVVSTAITMPQGAAVTLRQRFAPELYDPDGEDVQEPGANSGGAQTQEEGQASARPGASSESGAPEEDIPEEYRGALISETMDGGDNPAFIRYGDAWIRNYTSVSASGLQEILSEPCDIAGGTARPQILIYHTHATEGYTDGDGDYYDLRSTWRSTDDDENMVAVGEALKEGLEAEGFTVYHDTTQHDYPSYNGAYERSMVTIEDYLEKYPGVTVLLDLHRDAILRDDNTVIKPTVTTGDGPAAQIMAAVGWDPDGDPNGHWQENLRFAAALTARAQADTPGLMRPVYFIERGYNQSAAPGALLLEFGSNGNTLEEAKLAARLLAPSLAAVLRGENTP